MRYTAVVSLQPVQIVLLLSVLVGAFLLGRCSVDQCPIEQIKSDQSDQLDQSVLDNLATVLREQEQQEAIYYYSYNAYDEQSRDSRAIRLDEQCCSLPFPYFLRDGKVSRTILVAPEQQSQHSPLHSPQKLLQHPLQPIIILKPLQKKKRIALPKSSAHFFFPQQKKYKKYTALPRSPVKVFFPQKKKRIVSLRNSAQNFLPQQKRHVTPPRSSAQKFFSQKKRRVAPSKRSGQKFLPQRVGKKYEQFACKGRLIPAVLSTVTELEAQSILYGTGPLSDCSGIFHRVLKGLKKRCPGHAYPPLSQYRDSRNIARWYHERGELLLIKDPLKQTSVIRPGMVLFFGHTGVWYKNPSVKTLLSPRRGIYHVGVVARVHRDATGKIVQYELFHGHGQRGRTTASVTTWHKRKPDRAGYPPFGNGRQQLVAAARIIWPVEAGK